MADRITLSAPHETKQALVLAELAKQCGLKWQNTPFGAEASGALAEGRRSVAICLHIGSHEGVHLEEEESARHTFSRENGTLHIAIGKKLPETDVPNVTERIAESLIVLYGKNRQP